MAKEDRRNLCFEVRHFRLVNCHAVWLKDSSCNYFPLKCRNVCKMYFEQSSQKSYLEFQKIVSCALVSNVMCHPYGRHVQGRKVTKMHFKQKVKKLYPSKIKMRRSDSFAGFFIFIFFGYSAQKLLVLLNICVAHRNALLELE